MNSYRKLCTQFYDIDKPAAPADALAFYLRYVEQANGPVLEAMCGSGRFLIPILQRGFDIEGVDASPHMLGACRENCQRLGLTPVLHEQYMHELDLSRRYALVFIPAGSFNLVERDQARESLRRIHAMLRPGGKLVLEIAQYKPRPSGSWPWAGRWVQRPDGAKIIISWLGYHDAEQRVTRSIHRYDLVKDGRLLETEFEDFGGPDYEPAEFRELLSASGFTQIRTFKPYELREPDETDEDVMFECARP